MIAMGLPSPPMPTGTLPLADDVHCPPDMLIAQLMTPDLACQYRVGSPSTIIVVSSSRRTVDVDFSVSTPTSGVRSVHDALTVPSHAVPLGLHPQSGSTPNPSPIVYAQSL